MEENKREIKKEEIKLLIYLEDNDEVKNKKVIILEQTEIGVSFFLLDENLNRIGTQTFIPWSRILKIKNVGEAE